MYLLSSTLQMRSATRPSPPQSWRNQSALMRTRSLGVLRLASAHGVFETEGDKFRHSAASRMLRTDHPQSMRAFVRMFGLAINWGAYGELEYSVRSGRSAMERTLPGGFWSYLAQHPEPNSIFNATMLAKAQGQIPRDCRILRFFGVQNNWRYRRRARSSFERNT
jgi:hypothetical protein